MAMNAKPGITMKSHLELWCLLMESEWSKLVGGIMEDGFLQG